MTPAARVQAAIEVLDDVLTGTPAEKCLTNWARRSRFAGSKDRRAVRDHVYEALRSRRSFAALGGALTGRGLMIGACRAAGADLSAVFSGQGHAPEPLSVAERQSPDTNADPQAAWDLPDWMIPLFQASLDEDAMSTAQTLTERAPIMLRVNSRKATLDQCITRLSEDQIEADRCDISPNALRVAHGGPRVQNTSVYGDGWIELQDGSSQAAMQTVAVPAGGRVLDYCVGGGGKTLALAAEHEAKWFAHDALPQRMTDIPERANRAGIKITQLDTADLASQDPFDVVLCDVPCSGSGTWRRTPQAKWLLAPEALEELRSVQAQILAQAARLVSPQGTLIYATCSLFGQENELQIDQFLSQNPEWVCAKSRKWNVSPAGDGFFVAHLTRVGI